MDVSYLNSFLEESQYQSLEKTASANDDLVSRAQKVIEDLENESVKQASPTSIIEQMDVLICKTANDIREEIGLDSQRNCGIDETDVIDYFLGSWY